MLMFFLLTCSVFGATVTLDWYRNPEPDVNHYRIYYGNYSGVYFDCTDVFNQTNVTLLLPAGTWFFAATALNDAGMESRLSQEISWTSPPDTNLYLIMESSQNRSNGWRALFTNSVTATNTQQFYRLRIEKP